MMKDEIKKFFFSPPRGNSRIKVNVTDYFCFQRGGDAQAGYRRQELRTLVLWLKWFSCYGV